jgi:hypothetical protein
MPQVSFRRRVGQSRRTSSGTGTNSCYCSPCMLLQRLTLGLRPAPNKVEITYESAHSFLLTVYMQVEKQRHRKVPPSSFVCSRICIVLGPC